MESTKMTFDSWTDYDCWLVENYNDKSIFKVEESDGKINIEYCSKADFEKMRKNEA